MSKGLYRDVTQSLGWKGTRSGIKLPAQLVDRRKRMKSDNNLIHVSRIVKLHWCSVKTLKNQVDIAAYLNGQATKDENARYGLNRLTQKPDTS